MSDDLVERVARAMREAYIKAHDDPPYNNEAHYPLYMFTDEARAAIAVVLEEAAKALDRRADLFRMSPNGVEIKQCAAAIRALVTEPIDPGPASGFGS